MGITHLDDVPKYPLVLGHLNAHWSLLGEDAGCRTVGVRRIEVTEGGWSTPAHDHGREEEIFYVLNGRGLVWREGRTAEVRAGDCMVFRPRHGAHTLHALEPLDVLAFGPREADESVRFPRLGHSLLNGRWVKSGPGSVERVPVQFVEEAKAGPPELPPEPGERPDSIVNVADVEAGTVERGRVGCARRNLGRAAGSVRTGLQHVEVAAEKESTPAHCHSLEEEIFVVLGGAGALVLEGKDGTSEVPLRVGNVVSRPAGSGVAHLMRASADGLTYLAYGPREPGDMCYYPRSKKISFRGLGVIARVEKLDYWDGEG
jgi:uncharacterized cupin superfamily protein